MGLGRLGIKDRPEVVMDPRKCKRIKEVVVDGIRRFVQCQGWATRSGNGYCFGCARSDPTLIDGRVPREA